MSKIQESLLLTSYQQDKRKTGSDVLGKDDFLKILMTQLQNQDPMNPMQDKDFVAQMATFSSLEQITNMGKSIEKFVSVQQQSQLISYNQFVGREVTWHKLTENEDPNKAPIISEGKGIVSSVQFKEDSVIFILKDGTTLEPGNISQINQSNTTNSLLTASELIGKMVTWKNESGVEVSARVKSVQTKDGQTVFEMDNEEKSKIISDQMISISA
ncbi:flagellar hook assembly protein FlgD [Peribacillus alkalitolerans]|uniref:flagellar hook assembly protein FlgD n=1 Tax=Peribacillus alkalitolerans TaxID=1550385 RepID=UPI0013D211F8|nr:flagellar hook assembly protein FlgD [Peribacillus alkalitolerans]